ncbi:hypothetical protein [Streptomyces sp. NRRL F-5135]|uniref:hypothetical protein n=1 Tax=Streptomyces sp. NRRL F-5135 TaxID=1463858 RepID=UPI0004CA9889|nr:hypothetical protein [Streptomyces sp. NRRL F-5135]
MWPGQQPPGGEQNPQDQTPNPYQQPGYQQPNPYQQPGYQQPGYQQPGHPPSGQQPAQPGPPGPPGPTGQQPNPYQQPTVPQQYSVPGPPGGPGPSKDKKNTTVVAAVAAAVVVAVAAGTAFFVLGDDDKKKDTASGDDKASASASAPEEDPAPAESVANPRDGSANKPQISGWKVVTNPKHGTQFDVPADWEVDKPDVHSGFEDAAKGDGSPVVTFSAPATYKSQWCSQDTNKDGKQEDSSLAGVGTKGGRGAKDTASAARSEAGTWVWAAYDQAQTPEEATKSGTVKMSEAEAYTTTTGLKGHFATATATGVAKKNKCDTDGKSIAFTFTNAKGDYATWVLYANAGVPDELSDDTMKKIMSTVRLASPPA